MSQYEACLTCTHVVFSVPPDWKPAYEGDEYDVMDVIKTIRKSEKHVMAQCALNPVWLPVSTAHHCGQWCRGHHYILGGRKSLTDIVHGTWDERQVKTLTEDVKRLQNQLKRARQISASRLARMRAKGKK